MSRKSKVSTEIKVCLCCTRSARYPEHTLKNHLQREFHANAPNEKWLTDVTEFKYYLGIEDY